MSVLHINLVRRHLVKINQDDEDLFSLISLNKTIIEADRS